MHDRDRHRRLATFAAHHSGKLYTMTGTFVDRLAGVFAPVRSMLPLHSKDARFRTASDIAEVIKNLGDLDAAAPLLARARRRLGASGFTREHVPAARSAFLNALRGHAGGDWNAEIERDWGQTFDAFVSKLNLAPGLAVRLAA